MRTPDTSQTDELSVAEDFEKLTSRLTKLENRLYYGTPHPDSIITFGDLERLYPKTVQSFEDEDTVGSHNDSHSSRSTSAPVDTLKEITSDRHDYEYTTTPQNHNSESEQASSGLDSESHAECSICEDSHDDGACWDEDGTDSIDSQTRVGIDYIPGDANLPDSSELSEIDSGDYDDIETVVISEKNIRTIALQTAFCDSVHSGGNELEIYLEPPYERVMDAQIAIQDASPSQWPSNCALNLLDPNDLVADEGRLFAEEDPNSTWARTVVMVDVSLYIGNT